MDFTPKDLDIMKTHIQAWTPLSFEQVEADRLAGLSNLIWKVSIKDSTSSIIPKEVVFRRFGNNNGSMDRDTENRVFSELARLDVGPNCYGYNNKYRIEQFFNAREIKADTIYNTKTHRYIARSLATMHQCEFDIEKKPVILKMLSPEKHLVGDFEKKIADTSKFTPEELKMIDEIKQLISPTETEFLLSNIRRIQPLVVFSHNDLHSGNILKHKDNEEYFFIDFEYSHYNYRGFDIANLLVESMMDYSYDKPPYYTIVESKYPDRDVARDFLDYYAFFTVTMSKLDHAESEKLLNDKALLQKKIEELGLKELVDELVAKLQKEVEFCSLLTNYHWVLWAIIYSKNPDIKFDYVLYAYERLRLYRNEKAEYIKSQVGKQGLVVEEQKVDK